VTTASVATTAGRALLRSGLLRPPGPRALFRTIREVGRGGTNPATLLAVAAARWPDRAAVIDDNGATRYCELQSRTESLASELYRDGVGPGQAVGILCRNGPHFVEALFAAALVGADVVLLNTDFRTDALAATLSAHRIATVVCDNEFADRLQSGRDAVTVVDPATADTHDHDSRPKVAAAGRIVVLTSGTTGKPKGVPRKPTIGSAALGIGASILDRTGLRMGSRIAVAVPMFHGLGLGMLILTMALGGTILTRRRFDAEAALVQASQCRADALTAVPVVLARILDLPEAVRARNPLRLRVVISSGARLDPSLARRFMDTYGDIIYNGYGSSEVGIGALATPADLREAPETVGRPVAGCPVRIFDGNDRPVGPHVTGRVFVGGDLTFDTYIGGGTKDVVGNMTSTGDMGYFDEAGRLFIVGREDDMIVSGGENVYPRGVENALAEHPDVADNAVIGVPDADYGQRLVAFVVPQSGIEIDTATIRDYLKDRVSRFEQPRDITVVAKISRNPAGKILRNELPT
jgi:acyl-CoA synthetase (AMP-forming)/AMP-acid ligase II